MAKFNSDCDAGGLIPSLISYTLQIDLKAQRTRITLISEGNVVTPVGYAPSTHGLGYSKSYFEATKGCRDFIVNALEGELKVSSNDNW